jgi:DinB superfamily
MEGSYRRDSGGLRNPHREGETMYTIIRRWASFALLAPLLLSARVCAQELSPADKDKALQLLETSKKGVLDATKDLSPAQWIFKSAPDRWSIAECMEHIAAAEDFIRSLIIEKVMIMPAAPGRDVVAIEASIIANVPDRANKVQAPEPLKPTNRFDSPQGSIDHFVASRAKTEEFLKSTPGLREHAADSPAGTKWDAYEFLLFIGAHSERHTKQILEVKSDPNYPKS